MLVPAVVILADEPVRRPDDGLGGAVVRLQQQHPAAGIIFLKSQQGLWLRRPEAIDALVLVPYQEEVSILPRQQPEDGVLDL